MPRLNTYRDQIEGVSRISVAEVEITVGNKNVSASDPDIPSS
jgi:hypothetical protein